MSLDFRVLLLKKKANKTGLLARLQNEKEENLSIKPFDYGVLDRIIKKNTKVTSQDAVDNLIKRQEEARKRRLLQQHRATWLWEWSMLKSQENMVALELSNLLSMWQVKESALAEINDLEERLNAETRDFRKNTVYPIYMLRDDLKFWMKASNSRDIPGLGNAQAVSQIINDVYEQQETIMEGLKDELMELENEIMNHTKRKARNMCQLQGIPLSLDLHLCPDGVYHSIADEFLILDIKYQGRINDIQNKYKTVTCTPLDGWSPEDHAIFQHVCHLYSVLPENQQELLFDMLLMLFPNSNMDDLLTHERWMKQHRQYTSAVSAVISDWKRSKLEFEKKAKILVSKALDAIEKSGESSLSYCKQKLICDDMWSLGGSKNCWKFT